MYLEIYEDMDFIIETFYEESETFGTWYDIYEANGFGEDAEDCLLDGRIYLN